MQAGVVYVLTPDSVIALPVNTIRGAKLTTFDSEYSSFAVWTIVGGLSSI